MSNATNPKAARGSQAKPSSRVDNETAEDQHDDGQAGEEDEDIARQVLGVIPAWFISLVVHSILVLVLMFVTLTGPERKVVKIVSVDEEEEVIEEVVEIDLVIEEIEVEEESSSKAESVDVVAEIVSVEIPTSDALDTVASLASEFEGFDSMVNEGELDGLADVAGTNEMVFFGAKAVANRVIFIVDNSNSMGGGRLETALIELQRAIYLLSPKQKFYVIFYSDTGYPLFHPNPVSRMVPATDANKQKAAYWLNSIQMCLRTDIRDAVKIARQLDPDLIYILGDGAFNTSALTDEPLKGVTIHTLGMGVAPKSQKGFRQIANMHRGKYTDVGITKEGLALFKKAGSRKRNNTKGLVWGIKLPAK